MSKHSGLAVLSLPTHSVQTEIEQKCFVTFQNYLQIAFTPRLRLEKDCDQGN